MLQVAETSLKKIVSKIIINKMKYYGRLANESGGTR